MLDPELLDLLRALSGVRQDLRYHPEGDALYHSLQVFDLARRDSNDPDLWAAALFHDVGKAHPDDDVAHDELGADLLEGLLSERVVWLVRHHLDLLRAPGRTRRRYARTTQLRDLERLRRYDLGGRNPNARVLTPEVAFTLLDEQMSYERNMV
jgi:HD superfamily phosphodiesterase